MPFSGGCPVGNCRIGACLLLLGLLGRADPASAANPSNAAANASTRSLYDYLTSLSRATRAKLLSGQHMGLTTSFAASNMTVAYGYEHFVVPLVGLTGRHIAIVGADYGPADASVSYPVDYGARMTQAIFMVWRRSGGSL